MCDCHQFEGYEAEFAINGYSAIAVVERFKPDVVLLDLGLPGLTGFDVCKWLKRHPQYQHTRVIAVTGYGSADDRVLVALLFASA